MFKVGTSQFEFAAHPPLDGDIGNVAHNPGTGSLSVDPETALPIGTELELWLLYSYSPAFGDHTMVVSFVPDCGPPVVLPIMLPLAG